MAQKNAITHEYQKIPLLWTFTVRYDGRHRARLVAGGHVIEELENDYYSGVVGLGIIRIAFAAAILWDLKVITADIASVYIHACTVEKVHITADPEFGKME